MDRSRRRSRTNSLTKSNPKPNVVLDESITLLEPIDDKKFPGVKRAQSLVSVNDGSSTTSAPNSARGSIQKSKSTFVAKRRESAKNRRNSSKDNNSDSSEDQPLIVQLGGCLTKGLSQEKFLEVLESKGISRDSPKFAPTRAILERLPDPLRANEVEYLKQHDVFVSRAIDEELVIHEFANFIDVLEEVFDEVEQDNEGEIVKYIPQLAKVDADQFGFSICSIDAQQYKMGDSDTYFCIQSICQTITYLLALEEHGEDYVHAHVGREPSGAGFNERILNADNLPHNPYINSGAIMCCSMVKANELMANRFDYVMDVWSRVTGGGRPTFANSVYLSEKATADRNFCLAYMMNEANAFPRGTDLLATLEFYFMLCSIEVTVDMLAVAAGTLASGGVCPITGERIFSERNVRDCLSLVASCGMYDASGEFIFDIGFPAKSGVGGGLLIVIPGVMGMCTWSPKLEKNGNSYRGIRFCEQLVSKLDYHQFSIRYSRCVDEAYHKFMDHVGTELLFAISRNDMDRVRVCIAANPKSVNFADYDKRTPLHIACSFGNLEICKYLLSHNGNVNAEDFLKNKPIDDAKREKHKPIIKFLLQQQQQQQQIEYKEKYGKHFRGKSGALFASLDDIAEGKVNKQTLIELLIKTGFSKSYYWKDLYEVIENSIHEDYFDLDTFIPITRKFPVLKRCITGNLSIAEWDKFTAMIKEIFENSAKEKISELNEINLNFSNPNLSTSTQKIITPSLQRNTKFPQIDFNTVSNSPKKLSSSKNKHHHNLGDNLLSSNLENLAKNWEMSFCSTSGQLFNTNPNEKLWCIDTMTTIVNYIIAQELLGEEIVHKYVGKEPAGRHHNEFNLNSHGIPHNPALHAGALLIISLIKPNESKEDRFAYIVSQWNKFTLGLNSVSFDAKTFQNELTNISRKWTLAYRLLDSGVFPDYVKTHDDLKQTVELYLMTLSLLASTEKLSILGSVLANGGVNPFTRERILQKKHVRNALSIMFACGMFSWSGEFTFRVGIPAQSGYGGGILAVVPDLGGFCTWAPELDKFGNSIRGIRFFCELTSNFNFHVYETLIRNKKDPTIFGGNWNDTRICNLLDAASKNDLVEVKKEIAFLDINSADYDDRTALHVAAENGHRFIVEYLLANGADANLQDRWGHKPIDCAKANKIKKLLSGEKLEPEKKKSRRKKRVLVSSRFSAKFK